MVSALIMATMLLKINSNFDCFSKIRKRLFEVKITCEVLFKTTILNLLI